MESLLISRCLLGENVRYDGANCLMRGDIVARLKSKYRLIMICPEVMAGMPIPREPIEIKDGKIINKKGEDLSEIFSPVQVSVLKLIKEHNIKKALLKEFSPSCGSKKVYSGSFDGTIIHGQGVIAAFCKDHGLTLYSEENVLELL